MADPITQFDWRYFSDQVMGGVSEGQAEITNDALRLTGRVSTANNGGFIQARADTGPFSESSTGLRLQVRGDGQQYFIHLRTRATRLPWQYYQATFASTREWQEITLLWSDFTASGPLLPRLPAPESIRSVALVAYGRDHDANVSLRAFAAIP